MFEKSEAKFPRTAAGLRLGLVTYMIKTMEDSVKQFGRAGI